MAVSESKLPSLGDGVAGGTVAKVMVAVGDAVTENDSLLELETDKAVIPVPAGMKGTVKEIKVREGQELKIGDVMVLLETAGAVVETKIEGKKSPEPAAKESSKPVASEFKIPNLGDGVEGGTIATFVAKEGTEVKSGDTLFELETDKAVVPVPADFSGIIKKILVKEGATVKVGQAILAFEGTTSGPAKVSTPSAPSPTQSAPAPTKSSAPTRPASAGALPPVTFTNASGKMIPGGPATRKLARELGVNLANVGGSARGGRVTVEDVKRYVKSVMQGGAGAGSGARAPLTLPDFNVFGKTRRQPLTKLRKIIASRLSDAWNRIPHVHQFQDVDVTELVDLQKKHGEAFKEKGSAISVTLFLIKGLAEALKAHPSFNASLDEAASELIFKEYLNIGVAVDTPEGLIVPVLKNVDKLSIFEIGFQLKEIAKKARERKVMPAELMGASMTLSNLGGIGGTHFTPIVNPPEVAILGTGRNSKKPVWINNQFVPRSILPICLAYDHRVIDGADGARFTVFLTQYLENWTKNNPPEALGLK